MRVLPAPIYVLACGLVDALRFFFVGGAWWPHHFILDSPRALTLNPSPRVLTLSRLARACEISVTG